MSDDFASAVGIARVPAQCRAAGRMVLIVMVIKMKGRGMCVSAEDNERNYSK